MNGAALGVASLRLTGRLALVLSALGLVDRGRYDVSVALAVFASIAVVCERGLTSLVRIRVEAGLVRRALRAVFESRTVVAASTKAQSTLIGGVADEARFVAELVPGAVADVIACAVVVVVATTLHVERRFLTLLVFAGSGLALVIALRLRVARASSRAWAAFAAHNQGVLDGLEGGPEIVAAGRAEAFESVLVANLVTLRRVSRIVAVEALVIGRIPILIAVAVAVAIPLLRGGAVPSVAEWAVMATMLTPFVGLATAAAAHRQIAPSRRALRELLELPSRQGGQRTFAAPAPIELGHASVRYGDAVALREVSFELDEPGLVVLRGPNGSGKTTVLRLLVGLVDLAEGAATIGGVPLGELDWKRARENLCLVFQKPYFSSESTVRESLRLLAGNVGDDVLRSALERFGAWEVLARKNGADPLGVRVDALSAGERQRVALARVLVRDVGLYLLDEPDANLDRAGVAKLCEVLAELAERSLVVVAAHTQDVEAIATRVVQLDGGRVVDEPAVSENRRADIPA